MLEIEEVEALRNSDVKIITLTSLDIGDVIVAEANTKPLFSSRNRIFQVVETFPDGDYFVSFLKEIKNNVD